MARTVVLSLAGILALSTPVAAGELEVAVARGVDAACLNFFWDFTSPLLPEHIFAPSLPITDPAVMEALIPPSHQHENAHAWHVQGFNARGADFFVVAYTASIAGDPMAVCRVVAPETNAGLMAYLLVQGLPAEIFSEPSEGGSPLYWLSYTKLGYDWTISVEAMSGEADWTEVVTYRKIQ